MAISAPEETAALETYQAQQAVFLIFLPSGRDKPRRNMDNQQRPSEADQGKLQRRASAEQ
jgi:hypothetical protein